MNSQSSQNLIGFLTKKSLFKTQTKQKQINFSDLNSQNDPLSRSITPKAKNQSHSQISQFNVFRDTSEKELYKKGISEIQKPTSRALTNTGIKPSQENRFDKIKPNNETYFSHVKQNTKQQNPQTSSFFKSTNNKTKNLFTGFNPSPQKTQTKTFESLQLEAERCLQNMSRQLSQEIHNLNENIQLFNIKMLKLLNTQLQSVKYKVVTMVEEVFKQSQKAIRLYIKQQQSQMLQEVISVKSQLEKQYSRIAQMSSRIKTNDWRKTAAEMIGTDLESHIDALVVKAKLIELQPPETNHQEKNDKLNEFTKILKEIAHVKNNLK